MKEIFITARNIKIRLLYKAILQPIFFSIEPESMHNAMLRFGRFLGSNMITRAITILSFSYSNKALEQKILGVRFPNPIGLAAGYDKNAILTDILPAAGFGFAEVGSITGEPCEGNPQPRLWRLPESKSLAVHYGLKNEGGEKISKKLKNKKFSIPIGISIAKTNNKDTVGLKEGIDDYVKAYTHFANIGNYYAVNISCPNTFGGQPFTDAGRLDKLLIEIDKIPTKKPIFLKLPPDLTKGEIDKMLQVADQHKVDGFICTNLSKKRGTRKIIDKNIPEKGTFSGKPVEEAANEQIRYVYRKSGGKYIIMGCGGVFSAEDAYKKIKLGASLVQLITGMIYEGPQLISEINQGLSRLLKKDDYSNISQAVGVDNK